jgi:plastocyanin
VLAASAIAVGAEAPPGAAAVTIDVASFSFGPKPIRLAAGQPVTLSFVNQSGSSHDFTAKEFFAAANVTSGTVHGGKIDLPPHATSTITLVPRAGTYAAHCSHFLHASMGMTDEIIVN